jgi:hypothetical protein
MRSAREGHSQVHGWVRVWILDCISRHHIVFFCVFLFPSNVNNQESTIILFSKSIGASDLLIFCHNKYTHLFFPLTNFVASSWPGATFLLPADRSSRVPQRLITLVWDHGDSRTNLELEFMFPAKCKQKSFVYHLTHLISIRWPPLLKCNSYLL